MEELRSKTNHEERIKTYSSELPKLLTESGYLSDVYSLLRFYREIALCVNRSYCDATTVCSYLFIDIQTFRQNYRPILDQWQAQLGETAPTDISELAEKSCSIQFLAYCKEVPASPDCQAIARG
jgi:hypothetical protein